MEVKGCVTTMTNLKMYNSEEDVELVRNDECSTPYYIHGFLKAEFDCTLRKRKSKNNPCPSTIEGHTIIYKAKLVSSKATIPCNYVVLKFSLNGVKHKISASLVGDNWFERLSDKKTNDPYTDTRLSEYIFSSMYDSFYKK